MDTNELIVQDLREKVGFNAEIDFMNMCKGVPIVFKGSIKAFLQDGILFEVRPPDSICLEWEKQTLILHDIFLAAIQGDVIAFDITTGLAKLSNFTYVERGFGQRSMVRVQPKNPIAVRVIFQGQELPGVIVDISLSGFGIEIEEFKSQPIQVGDSVVIKTAFIEREVEIPGTILGIFGDEPNIRMAVNFEHDAPGHAVVARYITHRRAEIRQEITDAYQKSLGAHV